MQGMYGAPPETGEDPFLRVTTPTDQFYIFTEDFSSMDLNRFFTWFSPEYGVVTNGILLTREEAMEQFRTLFMGAGSENLMAAGFYFNYGDFTGANTYMADCWLELKLWEDGEEHWYKMHHQLVFKIEDQAWYLVQWEYIPPDIGLPLDFQSLVMDNQDVPEHFRDYWPLYSETNTSLASVNAWPLLIGSNFADENSTQRVEGKTPSGSAWRLLDAVEAGKPTVLFFFSIQSNWMMSPEDLDTEMDFLSGLYDTFGFENLYIFGVTDASVEDAEWMGEAGYNDFALLHDEGSMMHAGLNIDEYPYTVVIDSEGTVVAICKTFRPSVLPMLEERISEVLEAAGSNN